MVKNLSGTQGFQVGLDKGPVCNDKHLLVFIPFLVAEEGWW